MTWISEPMTYMEITHFSKDNKKFTESRRLDPDNSVMDISFRLYEGDARVKVELYSVEHLGQSVNVVYDNGVVNGLFVGIREGDIDYIGKLWIPKNFSEIHIEQYFFKKGKPSSFDFGFRYGTGWPLDRAPVLDDKLKVYFTDLVSRLDIGKNLSTCIFKLEKPGPEYKGVSDGNILFDMFKN